MLWGLYLWLRFLSGGHRQRLLQHELRFEGTVHVRRVQQILARGTTIQSLCQLFQYLSRMPTSHRPQLRIGVLLLFVTIFIVSPRSLTSQSLHLTIAAVEDTRSTTECQHWYLHGCCHEFWSLRKLQSQLQVLSSSTYSTLILKIAWSA